MIRDLFPTRTYTITTLAAQRHATTIRHVSLFINCTAKMACNPILKIEDQLLARMIIFMLTYES